MKTLFKEKMYRCKHHHSNIVSATEINDYCDYADCQKITKEKCEGCPNFNSKFIEYPITVNKIENDFGDSKGLGHEIGVPVKIRPCGNEYDKKTYFGIYLGDLPVSNFVMYNKGTGNLSILPHRNPAIYVPELKKIIYGCESWWCEIKDEEDIKEITDDDINGQWYVRLAKGLLKGE